MIEEEIPLYPILPRHGSRLVPGNTYVIDEEMSCLVQMRHCTGLNCEGSGFLGSAQDLAKNAVISSDNYDSRPFTPPIGDTLTVVSQLNQSDRCESCVQGGGVCVTLGPHDSSEIYTLEYLYPKYLTKLIDAPIGSVVRLVENGDGPPLLASGVNLNMGINFLVVYSNGVKTLQRSKLGGGNSEIVLEPEPDSIVEIKRIPDGAELWARCWEVGEPAEPFQEKEYWGLINELPLGSLVRVPKETKGRRILESGSVLPEDCIEETVFTVDLHDGKPILKGVFRDSDDFKEKDIEPKDFVISDDVALSVITTPIESKIWAQVREADNSNKTRSGLRDTFRTLAERLLRNPQ